MNEKGAVQKEKEEPQTGVTDRKDLPALWAIGILVSLLLSFVGNIWNPPSYEARQSTSLDETEAMVENTQNQLVSDALNDGTIPEYDRTMEKLVKLRPWYIRTFNDIFRLILFPSAPIVIIGLLILKSLPKPKVRRKRKRKIEKK